MNIDEAWFAQLAQSGIRGLRAYDPGHDLVVWRRRFANKVLTELGSNENSFGPSPLAIQAAHDSLQHAWRYPDPLGGDLKRALALHHGLEANQIYLGNGSHEILMQIVQAFCEPDAAVLVSEYAFAVYAIAAQAANAPLMVAKANNRDHDSMPRGHRVDNLVDQAERGAHLLCLANPNNPTGTWLKSGELQYLLNTITREDPTRLIVIDEAYAEYVDDPDYQSAVTLLNHYPNLIVTRTFSKAYALAGLRVGYALAHPGCVAVLERLRESFNVNNVALAAAEAALNDQAHLQQVVFKTQQSRRYVAEQLTQRGLRVSPSQTNFLLVEFGDKADAVEAGLLARGVIPRPMRGYGLSDCLRITVGTDEENKILLSALDEVLR